MGAYVESDLLAAVRAANDGHRDCLQRAELELRTIANAIGLLSARKQRKLYRDTRLSADIIHNEAERCRDILTLLGNLGAAPDR